MRIIQYSFKAFIVSQCIIYNNQMGHWNLETNKLVFNRRLKMLCRDCSLDFPFRYKISTNQILNKTQFIKKFSILHRRCVECQTSLYTLKFKKIQTNYVTR